MIDTFVEQSRHPVSKNDKSGESGLWVDASRLTRLMSEQPRRVTVVRQIRHCLAEIDAARARGWTWQSIANELGLPYSTLVGAVKAARRQTLPASGALSETHAHGTRPSPTTSAIQGPDRAHPKTNTPGITTLGRSAAVRFGLEGRIGQGA